MYSAITKSKIAKEGKKKSKGPISQNHPTPRTMWPQLRQIPTPRTRVQHTLSCNRSCARNTRSVSRRTKNVDRIQSSFWSGAEQGSRRLDSDGRDHNICLEDCVLQCVQAYSVSLSLSLRDNTIMSVIAAFTSHIVRAPKPFVFSSWLRSKEGEYTPAPTARLWIVYAGLGALCGRQRRRVFNPTGWYGQSVRKMDFAFAGDITFVIHYDNL